MRSRALLSCIAIAAALAAVCAGAEEGRDSDDPRRDAAQEPAAWADEDHSYDRARRAAERGEILPLPVIYERALARFPGRVLEAELERERGLWVYELKVLDEGGRLFEVYLDARSGAVLEYEEED